jgi:DNA topoisomerase-6 subunit B
MQHRERRLVAKTTEKITKSSTAEYFAKNLQQVGFSSPTKAVLTTLKEAVDNSLDACEEAGIAPEINIVVKRVGKGSAKNTDLLEVMVEDNGPGLEAEDLPQVFGEYLASSKFGRGRCTRGQQGIGISAATTWAQLTNATGVRVVSKTAKMRKAVEATIDVDIKANRGIIKNKETVDWNKPHGLKATFRIDGRIQLNGDGGLLTYLEGTTLVNPHLSLTYKLMDNEKVTTERVTSEMPSVPESTLPHPHTMKLGEFLGHAHLFPQLSLQNFLVKGFSRVTDQSIKDIAKKGIPKGLLSKSVGKIAEKEFKDIFQAIQEAELQSPSTKSVLTIGEEGLSKSINRLGLIDFFSVVTRKPKICDFKPVVVEVAIARFQDRVRKDGEEDPVQLLRFANRVPLQFDKSACAITRSVESVNWRAYGITQPKGSLPLGPYVFAVSVTSPFIKFKNASKETIDASDELVEELRLALIQAGQKLSRHIKAENKAADLERKISHIEKFGPILVEGLARLSGANETRKKKATEGLNKLLGRDARAAETELQEANVKLKHLKKRQAEKLGEAYDENGEVLSEEILLQEQEMIEASKAADAAEEKVAENRGSKKATKKEMPPKTATKKATKKAVKK